MFIVVCNWKLNILGFRCIKILFKLFIDYKNNLQLPLCITITFYTDEILVGTLEQSQKE